jgi:hypothetical protein
MEIDGTNDSLSETEHFFFRYDKTKVSERIVTVSIHLLTSSSSRRTREYHVSETGFVSVLK